MSEPTVTAPHAPHTPGGKGNLGFLSNKVGPLPLGVWLAAAVVIWWYMQRKNSATGSSAVTAGSQTDPAGNVGYIDPATGYVYGSPEDQARIAANSGGGTSANTTSSTGSGAAYADNAAWARAAINYLVARGVDPTQANQAIQNYITSQTLTTVEQGDVNLAIQGLGAPPDIPGPSSTSPGQIVTPPGSNPPPSTHPATGPVTKFPAPTGAHVTDTSTSSVGLQWDQTPGTVGSNKVYPHNYTVRIWQLNGKVAAESTVSPDAQGGKVNTTITGLHTKWQYKAQIWANGGLQAPPGASVSFQCK